MDRKQQKVRLLYRSLDQGRTFSRLETIVLPPLQLITHWAIEVGEEGKGYIFELQFNKTGLNIRYRNSNDQEGERRLYKSVPLIFNHIICGVTQLTPREILKEGQNIINRNPKYCLLSANCHAFALTLLYRIIDRTELRLQGIRSLYQFAQMSSIPFGRPMTSVLTLLGILRGPVARSKRTLKRSFNGTSALASRRPGREEVVHVTCTVDGECIEINQINRTGNEDLIGVTPVEVPCFEVDFDEMYLSTAKAADCWEALLSESIDEAIENLDNLFTGYIDQEDDKDDENYKDDEHTKDDENNKGYQAKDIWSPAYDSGQYESLDEVSLDDDNTCYWTTGLESNGDDSDEDEINFLTDLAAAIREIDLDSSDM